MIEIVGAFLVMGMESMILIGESIVEIKKRIDYIFDILFENLVINLIG